MHARPKSCARAEEGSPTPKTQANKGEPSPATAHISSEWKESPGIKQEQLDKKKQASKATNKDVPDMDEISKLNLNKQGRISANLGPLNQKHASFSIDIECGCVSAHMCIVCTLVLHWPCAKSWRLQAATPPHCVQCLAGLMQCLALASTAPPTDIWFMCEAQSGSDALSKVQVRKTVPKGGVKSLQCLPLEVLIQSDVL